MNKYRSRIVTTVSCVISAALIVPAAAQTNGTTPTTHDCRLRDPAAGLLYYAKAEYAVEANSNVIANPHICGALL